MAGPQRKFVRIKNAVLELLAASDLTGRELKIVLLVIRESWGWWGGKSNWTHIRLGPKRIAEGTGLSKGNASQLLQQLLDRNILQINDKRRGIGYLSFNEHGDQWFPKPEPTLKVPKTGTLGSQNRNPGFPISEP